MPPPPFWMILLLKMRRWFCQCAALVLVTGAPGTLVGGDYLPKVGPPPLRFEAPPGPDTRHYVLPPLDNPPALADAAAKTNSPPAPEPAPLSVTNEPPAPAPAEAPLVLNAVPVWPPHIGPIAPPETPLSPQMFLHYFSRGTGSNGPAGSVLVPMNFLPPLPLLPAPSSSAAYEVTPAPKTR